MTTILGIDAKYLKIVLVYRYIENNCLAVVQSCGHQKGFTACRQPVVGNR